MIDAKTYNRELREARKVRFRAQAAGRYLDALVRHMHRTRPSWAHLDAGSTAAQIHLLPN